MADDIVTRLRIIDHKSYALYATLGDAASEIERLRHIVDRLNAALDDIQHLTTDRNVLHRIKESRR